jgi:CRISPR-associated protein Cas2
MSVVAKSDSHAATRFRNFIKDDGYMMLQFSVYARLRQTDETVDKYLIPVTRDLPKKGAFQPYWKPISSAAA